MQWPCAITKLTERRPFPYAKVAAMWAAGKTIPQIAAAIGRVGDGEDRFHAVRVHLTLMHRGYRTPDGKLVKLPYRIGKKTLNLSRKAGKKAVS